MLLLSDFVSFFDGEQLLIYVIIALYSIGALLITLYSIGQYHLIYLYLKRRKIRSYYPELPEMEDGEWPVVTVQIPMFNERYVAKDVIDACAKLDYPKDKLEIQVLDDSTDDTTDIARERARFWAERGVDVTVRHRTNREGFKAGALKDGTPFAKGDFLAIFDADFRPHADFLRKTIPYFKNEEVGVVQCRWGHINRDYSFLTRGQTLLHDAFFMIEQQARALSGFFLRFNGSAGIWRKETVTDAGDWSGDTLSEDLDLALRAQMKGWKIVYDDSVDVPGEIPVTMNDLKIQQYRWTKGRGQVIRKLLPDLLRADLRPMVKAHAVFDLLNVFIVPGILLLATVSVIYILLMGQHPVMMKALFFLSVALINIAIAPWIAWLVMRIYGKFRFRDTMKEYVRVFPPFILIIAGIPFFQFVALVDGFLNRKSFFHRTSKYNITDKTDTWRSKVYSPKEVPVLTWFEGLLALYFLGGIFINFYVGTFGFLPFHILLFLSYTTVFSLSFAKG